MMTVEDVLTAFKKEAIKRKVFPKNAETLLKSKDPAICYMMFSMGLFDAGFYETLAKYGEDISEYIKNRKLKEVLRKKNPEALMHYFYEKIFEPIYNKIMTKKVLEYDVKKLSEVIKDKNVISFINKNIKDEISGELKQKEKAGVFDMVISDELKILPYGFHVLNHFVTAITKQYSKKIKQIITIKDGARLEIPLTIAYILFSHKIGKINENLAKDLIKTVIFYESKKGMDYNITEKAEQLFNELNRI